MEITRTILNSLSDNEVYNYLLNERSILYDKYNYLGISSEIMDKIIYDEISLSRDNYKNNGNYKNFLKNRIEARITALGTKLLNDEELTFHIIDKYIKECVELPNDYFEAKNSLKRICRLFATYSYIPEPHTIITLINNNNIFSSMLQLVVDNHLEYFKNYGVFQLFSDSSMASLISIYCMVRGITTSNNYFSEDDTSDVDSLGQYYEEISNVKPITASEMQEIGKRIKLGDEIARNRLVEANLKLVVPIAKRVYSMNKTVSFEDLINAGNIGVIKAACKFNVDLGFRFSTYADNWIRAEIIREIQNNGRTIRIPIATQEKMKNYNRLKEKIIQQSQSDIGTEEMAKKMHISANVAFQYECIQEPVVSLNTYVNDDENTEMQDIIPADDATFDMDSCFSTIDVDRLFAECELTDRESKVLLLKCGYLDGVPRTLEEIGNMFGVTRERIRQIEAKALYKLRTCEIIKKYVEYMDNPEEALKILERFAIIYCENKRNQKKTNPLVIRNHSNVKKRVK